MKPSFLALLSLLVALPLHGEDFIPATPSSLSTRGDVALTEYFRKEVAMLSEHCLAVVNTLDDWTSKRDEYRRELQEMLGLWPMPERTDLKPVITGRLESDEIVVEKLQFQASPGLYCTANLYLPKNVPFPAPTILYRCGHWRMITNGISLGNKAVYQIDGGWYARNGYVCLVLDSLLAGEIQGIHTGTRDHGLWWWNSRGYTPAGVEAWFGIRALDYLCTRREVDTNNIGVTGHSGGGAYSWTLTALDDRIKAAAPLAGMADTQSHILDGVLDHHCDCNFFVNIYRWDFPQLAALAAPRPLLIGGTDRDQLFYLSSTERIYDKVKRIFALYSATDKLGLAIAPGPHDEVPELRLATLRWFNRYLKGETRGTEKPIEVESRQYFPPMELRVFESLPADSINTNIADSFVPMAIPERKSTDELCSVLREKVFSAWPGDDLPLGPKRAFSVTRDGVQFSAWDFNSQHDVVLRLYLLESAAGRPAEFVTLNVLDSAAWAGWLAAVSARFAPELREEEGEGAQGADADSYEKLKNKLESEHTALAFIAPRGVGLDAWSGDAKRLTRIRRRFMLLGQTLDGMRVWDIRRAIQTIHFLREGDSAKLELRASGDMAVNALYAALFEPKVRKLQLTNLPESQTEGPDYLGVLKVTDIPEVKEAVAGRAELKLETE